MGGLSEIQAHTPNDTGEFHSLVDHLIAVADDASKFGSKFEAADACYVAGLWHDIGKAHPSFQSYLSAAARGEERQGVPHAIWGAALIHTMGAGDATLTEVGCPIAGHHAGLKEPSLIGQEARRAREETPQILEQLQHLASELPPPRSLHIGSIPRERREFRTRMILSALVDADRLDTEAHFDPIQAAARQRGTGFQRLWERFQADQEALMADAPETKVNRVRRRIYDACLEAATEPPGFFRLTVPTGGGKTRSGLAFALRHAIENDLGRVIVAIPYTSIIEQTADTYRRILGEDAVLEHHSQVTRADNENQDTHALRNRLAAENWDAPVIVTTTVQLFESMFSHHPSRVRKLHNIANSVLILDEAQTIPVGLLEPTLDGLNALVEDYGVSVVLSTATQPAFDHTSIASRVSSGTLREIGPDPAETFDQLRRVRYTIASSPLGWEDLAEEVRAQEQALVIVNTRKDALAVVEELDGLPGLLHLSTLLCGAHRRDVLAIAHHRLAQGEPVRLVSTQVVEAGVDIDFPDVHRAIGPLDRIIQAAGRCNREGRLEEGRVHVFDPAGGASPGGPYRHGLGLARSILEDAEPEELHRPEIFSGYFSQLYAEQDLDTKGVQAARRRLDFREVSARYRLIDQDTVPVVVDYDHEGFAVAKRWMAAPTRSNWSRLQAYTVSVYRHELEGYVREGWATPVEGDLHRWEGKYDELRGLVPSLHDPADLVR